jgi:hypothetical protein
MDVNVRRKALSRSRQARPRDGSRIRRRPPTLPQARQHASLVPIAVAVMDYSAHDPDHPAGADPWASSPQHHRTSFGQASASDIPSSPLPPQASPYGQDSDYGYMGNQEAQDRPNTASENGDAARPRPQSSGENDEAPPHQQPQQPQHQPPPAQGQPGHQQPQRYHGTRPQRQQPQYKLQAKVTSLERTGKKDPILRFDVYVRWKLPGRIPSASIPY